MTLISAPAGYGKTTLVTEWLDKLEIRQEDLRFTTDESANFLKRVMGPALSAEDMAALERRTEGWIAGL